MIGGTLADVRMEQVKELILHHVYSMSMDDLLKTVATKTHAVPTIYWADNIAFYFEPIPPIMNARIEDDYANGRDHWGEVYYSRLEKYEPTTELNDSEFRGVKIRIIDASSYVPHRDFARWANADYNK